MNVDTLTETTTISLTAAWAIGVAAVLVTAWILLAIYELKTGFKDLAHLLELRIQRIEDKIDGNVKRTDLHRWIAHLGARNPTLELPEDLP